MNKENYICNQCKKETTKDTLEIFGMCESCKDEEILRQEESDDLSGVAGYLKIK